MSESAFPSSTEIPAPADAAIRKAAPAVWLIAKTVWIEAIRRKDLWAVAVLMGIYLVAAIALEIVRGDSPLETQFVFNLGLTVSYYLAGILTALFAARQMPEEMENRTLYPLLAKPVRRSDVILGKFGAIVTVGVLTLLIFIAFVRCVSRWLPEFQPWLLAQCILLQIMALALVAAITLYATIWLPAIVSLLIGLLLFFAGGTLIEALKSNASGAWKSAVATGCLYLPNFSLLNLSTRFTDGGAALGADEFGRLMLYAAIFTALFLAAAIVDFERKAL
ncbi:MAG: ABC transporter permease [Candidatus Sumerlaeota bacterium]|nr:ABC transporter permease [Candidatus Sumerlaeota bacterium]